MSENIYPTNFLSKEEFLTSCRGHAEKTSHHLYQLEYHESHQDRKSAMTQAANLLGFF